MEVVLPRDSSQRPAATFMAMIGWSDSHRMVRTPSATVSSVQTPGMLARNSAGTRTTAFIVVSPPVPNAVFVTFFQSSGPGRFGSGMRSGSSPTPSTKPIIGRKLGPKLLRSTAERTMNSPAPAGFFCVPRPGATCRNPSSTLAPGAIGSFGVNTHSPARLATRCDHGLCRRSFAAFASSHSSPSKVNARSVKVVFGVTANCRIGASVRLVSTYLPATAIVPAAGSIVRSRSAPVMSGCGASRQVRS
ncbi:MAG: hypothetical protein RLZZ217_604, partial [Planctomycetota bacterium]